MLSRKNYKELIRKQRAKKQRFTIKKLTVGVASVLIGLTFTGLNISANASDSQPVGNTLVNDGNVNSNDEIIKQPTAPVATQVEGGRTTDPCHPESIKRN